MITSKNLLDPCMYIGSTQNYKRRMIQHKYNCNNLYSKEHHQLLYQYIRTNGGWDSFDTEIIYEFQCEDNKHKRMVEQEYINKFSNGLNSCKAYQPLARKEYFKAYNQKKKNTKP